MGFILAATGFILIAMAMLDVFWTTLAMGGGGPLTARVARGLWQVALRRHRTAASHRLLTVAGTFILLFTILLWIVLLWGGWVLLFSADAGAVVHGQTRAPADLWSRIYFTGYTLFTLGMGDYVPQGGVWKVATAAASLNGLFLITLSIAYLVPVVSAAVHKHQLAACVSDLGCTPGEIVCGAWDGNSFEGLTPYLVQLVPLIELHAQRHLAYPVLHYFHSPQRRTAVSVSLVALDEALLLMSEAVDPRVRLPTAATEPVRRAIAAFLEALHMKFIRTGETPTALPQLRILEEAGIPVVGSPVFRRAVEERSAHRTLLLAFVENDGRSWSDVWDRRDLRLGKRLPGKAPA